MTTARTSKTRQIGSGATAAVPDAVGRGSIKNSIGSLCSQNCLPHASWYEASFWLHKSALLCRAKLSVPLHLPACSSIQLAAQLCSQLRRSLQLPARAKPKASLLQRIASVSQVSPKCCLNLTDSTRFHNILELLKRIPYDFGEAMHEKPENSSCTR